MLTLQQLKDQCESIHYFGLGMIQIKMNDNLRYHFYTGKLDANILGSKHTHRYSFSSTVLAGVLFQRNYRMVVGRDYSRVEITCKEGCERIYTGSVNLKLEMSQDFHKGSSYFINKHTIHDVFGINCITEVVITSEKEDTCSIFLKPTKEDENPFIDGDESVLWNIVEEMLDEHFN